jgi:hypothetical protein
VLSNLKELCLISTRASPRVGRSRCRTPLYYISSHMRSRATCRVCRLARLFIDLMLSLTLRRLVTAPAHSSSAQGRRGSLSIRITFAHPSTSPRYHPCPPFLSTQRRSFVAGSTPRAPPPPSSSSPPIRRSILSRLLPASLLSDAGGTSSTSASFRKIVALARPERRPLLTAIGLLFVSSSVSLSIPFTVGKLIDYFTSSNPVGLSLSHCSRCYEALQTCCGFLPSMNLRNIKEQFLTSLFRSIDNSVWHLTDSSHRGSPPRIYYWWCLQCGTRISYAHVG